MKLTACITIASLLMYIWTFINVGKARGHYKINAPSCEGPVEFLSVLRVQANTVEQMVIFLPLLWICSTYMGDQVGAGIGAVWVIGRVIYALGYYKSPGKRTAGFVISSMAALTLLIASIAGVILH